MWKPFLCVISLHAVGGGLALRKAAMMAQAATMQARIVTTAAGSRTLPLGVQPRICTVA